MAQQLMIDFDKLVEIGRKGVRRAAVFMGLGLNAAYDPAFKSYQLKAVPDIEPRMMEIQLIPNKVSDNVLNHFKREFGLWIIGSGLREVIERFAIFLDGIHHSCQWIAVSKGILEPADAEKKQKNFEWEGIEGKLRHLETRFSVRPRYPDHIVSINKARHCLTHRLGKVGSDDCSCGTALEVKWTGMNVQIALESGEVIPIEKRQPEILIQGPGRVQLNNNVERCKLFSLGSILISKSMSWRKFAVSCSRL